MAHRIIIQDFVSPTDSTAAAATQSEPEFRIRIEYRPADGLTASQIGNEVARIQKRANQIIEGTPD